MKLSCVLRWRINTMPIYEYYCAKCDKTIELLRKLDDNDKPVSCAECKYCLVKIVTTANIHGNYH